jgi:hypothetical protein
MVARSVIVWFGLLALAVANGAAREAFLTPRVGTGAGHGISTLLLSVGILAVGWFSIPWIAPGSVQDAWLIGIIWVLLTVAFEFLGGHFLFGRPWKLLLADYNILAGRIWVMVLVVSLVTPVVAFTRRGTTAAGAPTFIQR